MRAKYIRKNLDPRLEFDQSEYIDYEEDEFGNIHYIFNNSGITGKITVNIWDIADFYRVSEDEMENNPHAITPEQLENYSKQLNRSTIIWGDEEGPNPDEMRDFRYDR